ncbi:MAG TPA: hypothetical protein VFX43_02065 [Chitinophagaceae bacterium]|nr:hypothetical protein [Chitinophagaceae bacterium]
MKKKFEMIGVVCVLFIVLVNFPIKAGDIASNMQGLTDHQQNIK